MVRADGLGWQHWREQVPAWIYPKQQENPDYSQLIIPTLDSVRYKRLFSLLHSVNKVRSSGVDELMDILIHCWPDFAGPTADMKDKL